MNNNVGKVILAGGLLLGGWWLWNRRNLDNQISVGAPKFKSLSGGKIHFALPITNISDVDVTFNGFIGSMISYYNNTNGLVLGAAIMNTPSGGTPIKAKSDTELDVVVSVNLLAAGSTLINLITSGDWSKANCWLKGNYFITSSNIQVPYSEKIV